MRVVFLTHAARRSGAEIGLVRLIEATRGRIEATVILAEDGDLVEALRDVGAEVLVLPMHEGARSLKRGELGVGPRQVAAAGHVGRYVLRLRSELRRLRPDLVHTLSLKAGPYGALASRLAGVPVVWHLHDHLIPEYLPARAVGPVRLLAGTLPDGLLVPSRSVLEAVGRTRRGMKVAILPFPVPQPAQPAEIRDEVAVVGMLGRLAPWKGQHVFLEAFARVFPEGPVRAHIVGSPMFGETDYEEQLHAQAAALGIAERVEFRGFRADVEAELRELDVLVHASVSADPLPGVVIEGLGAGLPVVATDAGGTPEYLRDGIDGLLHRPGDIQDLARALRQAAGSPAQRAALGASGRETVRQYGPDVIAERFITYYERVAR